MLRKIIEKTKLSAKPIKSIPRVLIKCFDSEIHVKSGKSLNFEKSKKPINVENYSFTLLSINKRKDTLLGINQEFSHIIKINLVDNPRKKNTLQEEASIIRFLNSKNCVSCPKIIGIGKIDSSALPDQFIRDIKDSLSKSIEYMILEYKGQSDKKIRLADLIFSIIEQKNLGVFQGDIKPENIIYNNQEGVCYIVDYDQAVKLTQDQINLNNTEFLDEWLNSFYQSKYKKNCWLSDFGFRSSKVLNSLFRNNAFRLDGTSLYRMQHSTNTKSGIYHSFDTDQLYAEGIRDISDRIPLLEKASFKKNETILDIGCNAGKLCHYLSDRGCIATGVDMDYPIIKAAQFISNILHKNCRFFVLDLDKVQKIDDFDTIMLFSVLHHTKNVENNASKIAKSCRRIFIECRLRESGRKVDNKGNWIVSSSWSFNSTKELEKYMENIFPGFSVFKNYGLADRDRYIIELRKS